MSAFANRQVESIELGDKLSLTVTELDWLPDSHPMVFVSADGSRELTVRGAFRDGRDEHSDRIAMDDL